MSVRRVTRRLLGAAGILLVANACLSPTLPLPPPSRPTVEGPDAAGNVRLLGRVPDHARVSALNTRTTYISGQQTEDGGAYDFLIGAEPGDELQLWYSQGNLTSPRIVIRIQNPNEEDDGMAGASGTE